MAVRSQFQAFYGKHKLLFMLLITLIVVILALAVAYVGMTYTIRSSGIALHPEADYPVPQTVYYLQNDARWANDTIGRSTSKMGGEGCLISSIATAMTHLGVGVTPGELNAALTQMDGYDGASVTWYKIHQAYPALDYRYTSVFTHDTIQNDLDAGLWPIIRVKYRQTGVWHWVLVVGAENGEFMVFDPLHTGGKAIPLSLHGNAYAYRVIIPAQQ